MMMRQRKRGGSLRPAAVLILLIALCIGAYWLLNGGTVSEKLADTKFEELQGLEDDGKNADYTKESGEIQVAVTAWLKSQGYTAETLQTEDREAARRQTGGKILWTTESVFVAPPPSFSKEALEQELAKSGGKVTLYRTESKQIGGSEVTEYDIALFDMLDKEQLFLVVAKVYVAASGTDSAAAKAVRDTLAKPAGKDAAKNKSGAPSASPAKTEGRLAIVIDDCGSNLGLIEELNALPVKLTYAVMPFKSATAASAESGYQAGRRIIVHLPMEPLNVASSEEIFISGDMSDSKIKATTAELLDQVPHAVGMNNHQGSAATADSRTMKAVMAVLKERGLSFLDSRTNSASVAAQTAEAMGVPETRNNLFIDNDADVGAVKERLRQAGRIAKANGSAVVIGHCRAKTIAAIREMIDELHHEGIDFVFVTDLM
ncbi:divergent polysaccharide deacetylase family protein [Megasphaera vaginalis (ex Srinivasan et al. 2021)]|nr:divergent polysaccharide deacetylase family protein [Megasphaera vaginalis (ex Srinivasan et al. 2021)]